MTIVVFLLPFTTSYENQFCLESTHLMATTRFVQQIGNVVPETVFLITKHQSSVFVFALRQSQVGSAVWRRLHLGTLASHSQRNCNNRRKCLCVFFNVIHNWRRDMQLRCLKMKKLNIKCVVEHIYLKLHHRNLWIQFVLVFFSPSK